MPQEGAVKEEKFPHPREPITSGEISWDKKGTSKAWRRAQLLVHCKPNREKLVSGMQATCCPPQPKTQACWYVWGLGPEGQAPEDRSRERTGRTRVGCTETA